MADVGLLRRIVPILVSTLQHYISPEYEIPRVQKRRNLDTKGNHRQLRICAEDLEYTLSSFLPDWKPPEDDDDIRNSVVELLRVIENDLLWQDAWKEDGYLGPDDYPALRHFMQNYAELESVSTEEQLEEWARAHLQLEYIPVQKANSLRTGLNACDEALSRYTPPSERYAERVEWAEAKKSIAEWAGAREFYPQAVRLHQALGKVWKCDYQHDCLARSSRFAFAPMPAAYGETIGCLVGWPDVQHDSLQWRFARLQYRSASGDRVAQFAQLVPSSDDVPLLTALGDGRSVKVLPEHQCKSDTVKSEESAVQGFDHQSFLYSWEQVLESDALSSTQTAHRLALALVLCYAYLYLGGSDWWPYDTHEVPYLYGSTELRHLEATHPPFFISPSVASSQSTSPAATDPRISLGIPDVSRAMPNLPILGKLILELLHGNKVEWHELGDVITEIERDDLWSRHALLAVKACTNVESFVNIFPEDKRIKDDEKLKKIFLDSVLYPLQYVLLKGFEMTIEQVFGELKQTMSSRQMSPLSDTNEAALSSDQLMSSSAASAIPGSIQHRPSSRERTISAPNVGKRKRNRRGTD